MRASSVVRNTAPACSAHARWRRSRLVSAPEGMTMENEVLITAVFVGAGLLAYVVIPGLLVVWDRVLDHIESGGNNPK
ncbi:MAG: hypothetical protein NTW33_09380 [Methanoregula sp.]|nr:hypothetical protein [Methanoregula sp.]